MTPIPVSVIVVSRDRPKALVRCVTALGQLRYPCFEVIVVADQNGVAAIESSALGAAIKCIPFDEANISAARNTGILHAAGEIVAFIDDDAVPEPSWLTYLTEPFRYRDVGAAGGYVRARNGISYQWKARTIDAEGVETSLNLSADQPVVLTPKPATAIKTQGTNMAFRRPVLAKMGGFDPAFRYFHDDADVNMRLAKQGVLTALVPLAEVHHGYQGNSSRKSNRVPRDLFQIGASWAVYLGKHCDTAKRAQVWARVQNNERNRLLRHMVTGGLEPRDVSAMMRGLRQGYSEGLSRKLADLVPIADCEDTFRRFVGNETAKSEVISGRVWSAKSLRTRAIAKVKSGHIVTLLMMSPTALFHRIWFHDDGYWVQRGGLFGRSERDSPLFRFYRFSRRVRVECFRIHRQRLL
ncbi:hypothetical protein SuNHUV7_14060 (plasmid) [Pseudoseohaeicola sp. NH-UV-7]|uniref:glycosyltransferase family 2 protein n=1 Tax=Sulfitobacter sp. TBRI5 TaxID=2989732 RepID=UPI003A7067D4